MSGAVFQQVELWSGGNVFNLGQAVYFSFTTLSTVGYGDITAVSNWGRTVVCIIMLFSLAIYPLITQVLLESFKSAPYKSQYSPFFWEKKGGHIVVVCPAKMRLAYLDAFLSEMYHPNHGVYTFDTVLLFDDDPDVYLEIMLRGYDFRDHIYTLVGKLHVQADLDRTDMRHARAVFVLPSRPCSTLQIDPMSHDE